MKISKKNFLSCGYLSYLQYSRLWDNISTFSSKVLFLSLISYSCLIHFRLETSWCMWYLALENIKKKLSCPFIPSTKSFIALQRYEIGHISFSVSRNGNCACGLTHLDSQTLHLATASSHSSHLAHVIPIIAIRVLRSLRLTVILLSLFHNY